MTESSNIDTSSSGSVSPAAIAAIPAVVALIVALFQIGVAHTTVLSPWKGGGFGMFSTVDVDTQRVVRLYLEVDDQWHPVVAPDEYADDVRSLQPMPTDSRTEELARRLAGAEWVERLGGPPSEIQRYLHETTPVTARFFEHRNSYHRDKYVVEPDRLRIQVLKKTFETDETTGRVGLEPIQDLVVTIHSPN